jgi:hypothetical protein
MFVIIYGFYDYILYLLHDMMAWSHLGLFFDQFLTFWSRFDERDLERPRSLVSVSFWSLWSLLGLTLVSSWSHLRDLNGLIWSRLGLAQVETQKRPRETKIRPKRDR